MVPRRPMVLTRRSWMIAFLGIATRCTAYTTLTYQTRTVLTGQHFSSSTLCSIHHPVYRFHPSRWRSSLGSRSSDAESLPSSTTSESNNQRVESLHAQLGKIGIDPLQLQQAALQSIQDPIQGYDGRYGKSAIKAYRTFIQPKKNKDATGDLTALAFRTAQQISFLQKRHESHQTEWIRHHDPDSEKTNPNPQTTFPIILILDNVRSALNVGSLFRTADAAGCAQVWTVGITPHPNGNGAEKLQKSALGAEIIVPNKHFSSVQDAIDSVRNSDEFSSYQIIGMETTNKSVDYTKMGYNQSRGVVLILGNEVTGVTPSVLDQLDSIVEIPTFGVKNSLNVAACAPIVLYEILRQWNLDDSKE